MAKITKIENWRVVIEPDDKWTRWNDREYREACEEILSMAKRHIDGIGSATIEFDKVEICGFCKHQWEIDPDDGLPCCCDKAQEEFKANEKPDRLPI